MKEITSDEYAKIQNATLRNILAKVQSGKVPTKQEWEFLAEARSSGETLPEMSIDHLPKTTKMSKRMIEIIIEQFNISQKNAEQWLQKLGGMRKGKLWPVREMLSVIQERKDSHSSSAVNNDLKRELLQEQIDLLRAKRKNAQGKLVEVSDVRIIIGNLVMIYNRGLEQFISYVASEFGDEHSLSIAQRMANDTRALIDREIDVFTK